MPKEFFIVPMVGAGTNFDGYRGKYTEEPGVLSSGTLRYSKQDSAIVMIESSQAQLDSVAAQSDATRISTEVQLDDTINGGQANSIEATLEAAEVPAQWVTAGLTRRQVIKITCGVFLFMQRLEGLFLKNMHVQLTAWVDAGNLTSIPGHENDDQLPKGDQYKAALALTWQELPPGVQAFLITVRDRQGWTNPDLGLTSTSTVKQIIKAMGAQGVGVRRRLARHGLTLNSAFSTFPQGMKDDLTDIISSFGWTPALLGLTGASSLRDLLKAASDQWSSKLIIIGGVEI